MSTLDATQNSASILQEENKRLRTAVEELSVLNEIATAITSIQSLEQIVDLIVRKCVKNLKVEQGVVMLLDEKDQNNPFHTMIRKQDSISNILPYRLDAQLTGWMLKNKNPLLINNLKNDTRFKFIIEEDFPINSLLSVPMMLKGKMIGLLTVFNKRVQSGFTIDDQRLLGIIAAQSAHVIENARLYQEEQAFRRLQEEMQVACEIQLDLLPKSNPNIKGYQIAGTSIPAKDVGGDYFDFIKIDDNHLTFCLGDISGKGIPAAILMSNLQATLRGQTLMNKGCKECVSFANDILYHNTAPTKFATLFYAILDSSNNEVTYCNAGHNDPLLISDGNKISKLSTGGIVVGVQPFIPFEEAKIPLNNNDTLVVFSDGITEAMNSKEEEFGDERLQAVLTENRNESAEKLIQIILKEVKHHAGNQPQMDDMTIVVIKRKE